jgi:hypothetical protein
MAAISAPCSIPRAARWYAPPQVGSYSTKKSRLPAGPGTPAAPAGCTAPARWRSPNNPDPVWRIRRAYVMILNHQTCQKDASFLINHHSSTITQDRTNFQKRIKI